MQVRRLTVTLAVTAVLVMLGSSCTNIGTGNNNDDPATVRLFIAESDFFSGLLENLNADSLTMSDNSLSINSDAVVRAYDGYVYVLERFGADNILKFDPAQTGVAGVVYQTHLGDSWNPQDIEFVSSTKAYVANQDEPKITVFNPETGAATAQIDISAYTFNPDSNATPYAGQMVLDGTDLYVLLQLRDGWNPGGKTLIIKINTATDAIVTADTIRCQYKNGYDMIIADGALYVTNPGSDYSSADGAVEKIDLTTKIVSTVITETVLAGSPHLIRHVSGDRFYVQVYVGWKNVKVVEIDAGAGTITATLPGIVDAFGGIAYDRTTGQLFVGERDSVQAGVLVFENNIKTAGPLTSDNTLPPYDLAVVR